ncbi:FMN reductase (NADH) RutF [compost metagenome]
MPAPDWQQLHGAPVLEGAQANLVCRLHAQHRAGDHTIVIGEVLHTLQATHDDAALVFFGGSYHRLHSQPTPEHSTPCA